MTTSTTLQPRLIVADAARAIEFYAAAFGAVETERFTGGDGKIVHAELRFDDVVLTLKDEEPGTPDVGPAPLEGSPVILSLHVPDVDAVGGRMEKAGAAVVYPIDDQPYGRMGRYRDPFGHVWILTQTRAGEQPEETTPVPFELTSTYLHLGDDGRIGQITVDDAFWSTIHERSELNEGQLVCVFRSESSWTVWEVHPAGDELVYLLSGAMTFVLEGPQGEQRISLTAPGGIVVPQGTWHTADVDAPGDLLTVTWGKGTEHRER